MQFRSKLIKWPTRSRFDGQAEKVKQEGDSIEGKVKGQGSKANMKPACGQQFGLT